MSTLIDLGKLRFHFRGDYAAATLYEYNDIVGYGGDLFVYVNSVGTLGNLPSNTTYWTKCVSGLLSQGVWSSATAYEPNDLVKYGGSYYRCIAVSTNHEPPNATYWEEFVSGFNHRGAWSAVTAYKVNDTVTYGGSSYRCIAVSTNHEPPNATYWQEFASAFNHRGAWSATTAYKLNDSVTYQGNTYRCVTVHTSTSSFYSDFVTNARWSLVARGVQNRGAYANSTAYFLNDLVTVGVSPNLSLYICTANHTSNAANITDVGEISNWSQLLTSQYQISNQGLQFAYFVGTF